MRKSIDNPIKAELYLEDWDCVSNSKVVEKL